MKEERRKRVDMSARAFDLSCVLVGCPGRDGKYFVQSRSKLKKLTSSAVIAVID